MGNNLSVYVVACGIPESWWTGVSGGDEGLKKWCHGGGWGRRLPWVIGRWLSKADVKLQVTSADKAAALVRRGMVWNGMKVVF